ncbi:processed acidic surface protein [Metabacillus arenae]|uniref:Processed acidic surface protein n=1 Tax=Metabacillus arenae TaxID=2771434 RepID=A0A926RX21_9BACI|nr:processed acidic surface protein [Metabacillus arenae]MBD1379712.1 processed acidic surface protein [Metabacillus arenae]
MKKGLLCMVAFILVLVSALPAFAAVKEEELQSYLDEIGLEREEFIEILTAYDYSLEDFESFEDLEFLLGGVVTEESVNELLEIYEMTREELTELLIEYGAMEKEDQIEDVFFFNFEIEEYIWLSYEESEEEYEDTEEIVDIEEIDQLFTELGLTEEELDRLFNHLIDVYDRNPSFDAQLEELSNRMLQFEEFESVDDLTAEQIAEMLSILTEMQKLLEVKTVFHLEKDGNKTEIGLESLLRLTNLDGSKLLVSVYDLSGNFLLDFHLTPEMVGSDLIENTANDVKETNEVVEEVVEKIEKLTSPSKSPKTVKGARMPETAGYYGEGLAAGAVLILAGVFLFRRKAA